MSNLLERAIIDAKALKEAALKNAEQLVIEKYSLEVKEAMNNLLEQDDTDALADLFGDAAAESPLSAEGDPTAEDTEDEGEGEPTISPDDIEAQIPDAFMTDDDEIIQIKLDSLDDEIEDDEDISPFAGGDEFADDEIGIDIQDDEELEATADFDTDLEADVDMGGDIGIDIAGDSPISAAALEEIIADALKDALTEEEELNELTEAMKNKDLLEVADALTDILYVTYGAGHAFGIDLDKCFDEVQNSNMSKLDKNGKPIYNEFGKVMKGPNYFKPDLSKFIKVNH